MFGFIKFWWDCLIHAFTKGWIAVGVVGTILSIVVPFLRNLNKNATKHQAFWDAVDRFGVAWACIGIFWVIVLVRVLWAPYWAWRKMKSERDAALSEDQITVIFGPGVAIGQSHGYPNWFRNAVKYLLEAGVLIRNRLNLENSISTADPNYTDIKDKGCVPCGKSWLRVLRQCVDDDFPPEERENFHSELFTFEHFASALNGKLPKDATLMHVRAEVSFDVSKLERLLEKLNKAEITPPPTPGKEASEMKPTS